MKTYVLYSHDANEEECTITVQCQTEDQARNICSAIQQALRANGTLKGGSAIENAGDSSVAVFKLAVGNG